MFLEIKLLIFISLLFTTIHNLIMKALLFLVIPLILASSIPGDGIEGCTGHESQFTLGEQLPELVQTIPNGKKYTLGIILI